MYKALNALSPAFMSDLLYIYEPAQATGSTPKRLHRGHPPTQKITGDRSIIVFYSAFEKTVECH